MNKKYNKTAYTFLLFFKYILQNRIFEIDNTIDYLWNDFSISVCPETILKYIRTLKSNGVVFKRLNNKQYELKKLPVSIDFTEDEKNILFKSTELKDFYIAENLTEFKKLINKLSLFYNNEKTNLYKNLSEYNSAEVLEQYCRDKQRLKITYLKDNQETTLLVEPQELIILNKIIYLKCYNVTNKVNALINISDITDIKQSPVKNKLTYIEQCVTLKFLNKCINNYVLKENEEIINKTKNELLIKSIYYDKELFFRHILRYMDNCVIVEPQKLREEFKNYLHEIYQMYD